MPRRARLSVPGIPWHIIQRGNNRSPCFYANDDCHRYLGIQTERADKYGCAAHAYVLMTDHVRMFLTPVREDSAALLMKHLGKRYVQYVNRTCRRSATLWEGRFKSCLVQDETYALTCYRYIELNPVRAQRVEQPSDCRWSSCRANGFGERDPLVTPYTHYVQLGRSIPERLKPYRALFAAHLDVERVEAIRQAANGNFVLGDSRFREEIACLLERRVTPGKNGRPSKQQSD